jgi:dolichol-phosphate mannosyltransferase
MICLALRSHRGNGSLPRTSTPWLVRKIRKSCRGFLAAVARRIVFAVWSAQTRGSISVANLREIFCQGQERYFPTWPGVLFISGGLGLVPQLLSKPLKGHMLLENDIRAMERSRESYWRRHSHTSTPKLHWRACQARHCFHVLPGETILELGAGTGLWTEQLTAVLRGENPITAAVFDDEFARIGMEKKLPNTTFVSVGQLSDLPAASFDFVIGEGTLSHDQYPENLEAIYRLLKPGGQFLFFEANYWNPLVFLKTSIRAIGRWAGDAPCQASMRKYKLMQLASNQGFSHIEIAPFDLVPRRTPRFLMRLAEPLAFILEYAPIIRHLCGSLYIWAKKPGEEGALRAQVNLASHAELYGSVSVVVPCHNEEMNIYPLSQKMLQMYGNYIHEIIFVNDNSTDRTSEVAREIGKREPRIKVLDRHPPNGVGNALRDGYAACTGRYILTMDSDFIQIVPELRDMFDVIAAGHDGAIGSRFSHESIMLNYPFAKILSNRAFHALANLLLPVRVRDASNNLKLYRSEILKQLKIEDPGFGANAETGLKPLVAGYDVQEVPISWVNRTLGMGSSTFRIQRVAPNYAAVLFRIVARAWRGSQSAARAQRALSTSARKSL